LLIPMARYVLLLSGLHNRVQRTGMLYDSSYSVCHLGTILIWGGQFNLLLSLTVLK
jgi:hypothetical protein